MARAKREQLPFGIVLEVLRDATGRVEASFASKLVATVDPSQPVIDSVVLKNLGLRLPWAKAPDRTAQVCNLHRKLRALSLEFLATETGTLPGASIRERPESQH